VDLRHDADVRDVLARRRVVAGDRQLERRAVVERVDRLHERLAERPLPHDGRAMVVAERCSDDLRRARAVAVDEHDDRQSCGGAADRAEHLVRLVAADEGDDDAAVEKERRHGDRLVEQATRILAEVEHEALDARTLEPADLPVENDRRADAERAQAHVAPAAARIREQARLHDGRLDRVAPHPQVEVVPAAREPEPN
jgi:hypothetical protein